MADQLKFQHFEVCQREDGSLVELGRGAMGITYKAFDTNLRCFVALKVINAALLGSDIARQRFLREARAAAALRHPNVATVFHLGEESGDYFYAMEFVDGETIEALMKRSGAIPPKDALLIVSQVARALGAAHKQGLVHRDLKPSNLMIVHEEGGDFTVKVIDFGLAKAADSSPGEDAATLTMGGFLGTPHFASPEQLEERDLDVRSDIYSLGVTLYYMLCGRAPFSGSLAQVMSQHLHREPPLDALAHLPRPLLDLLRHMLEKDPAARPQSPADLRNEVEQCLAAVKNSPSPQATPLPQSSDDFATQAMEDPPPTAPVGPGSLLAERYHLTRELPATQFGRLFHAESPDHPAGLAVLVLDPALLASSEACTRLEDCVMRYQRNQPPGLLKIYSLERLDAMSFLTLEWSTSGDFSRTANDTIAHALAAPGTSSIPPAKPSSPVPLILLSAAVLLAGGITTYVVTIPKPPVGTQSAPSPTPSPSPVASPSPTPAPSPTPSPTPDPVLQALEKSRSIAAEDPAAALELLTSSLRDHPGNQPLREAIAEFLTVTRERRENLTPGQLGALVEPMESAAAMDFLDAQYLLGEQLRITDPSAALRWAIAAAKGDDTDAMILAGLMLSNRLGDTPANLPEAAKWFQKAAAKGDPRGMYALGECYLMSKGVTRDPRVGLQWIQKAADQNNVQALNKLGDLHARGLPGILEKDLKQAFQFFTRAKDLGYPDAYGNLGALFMQAPGMKDEKLAVELFRQGTEKGDPRSMLFYAMCAEQGLGGLEKNPELAREWYVKAAEQGVPQAADWCKQNSIPFTPAR